MFRKIGLFFLSLWLLFILIIIITAVVPMCLYSECSFVGWIFLFENNIIPILCILSLVIGTVSYFDFIYSTEGTPELSFKITEIKKIDYEHLTFLTTYIIPLVCFQFDDPRYIIVFIIIITVIGMIYVKTDLFYANPTLAILGFRIYKINGDFRTEKRQNKILISKDNFLIGDQVKYYKLDDRIYYATKVINTNKNE